VEDTVSQSQARPVYPSDQTNDDSSIPVRVVSGNLTPIPPVVTTPPTFLSVTTSEDDTVFTPFSSLALTTGITISNQSGLLANVRLNGAGAIFQLGNGNIVTLTGLGNANQVAVASSEGSALIISAVGQ
jgi:hypothetical protein